MNIYDTCIVASLRVMTNECILHFLNKYKITDYRSNNVALIIRMPQSYYFQFLALLDTIFIDCILLPSRNYIEQIFIFLLNHV